MQIIVFRLNNLFFGISTEYIEEITTTMSATIVPKSQPWIQGLVNLRGSVLTLVNMHFLLELDDFNPERCYNNTIVAQLSKNNIALMVDEVIGVTNINRQDLQSVSDDENSYVSALVTVYDRVVNILELSNLFEENEG